MTPGAGLRGLLLAAALVAGGCSGPADAPAGTVVLDEWRIEATPPVDRTLHVRNEGQRQHQLVISRAGGGVLAMTNLLDPGESADVLLPEVGDLELTSRLITVEPGGVVLDDAAMGMFLTVTWGGETS